MLHDGGLMEHNLRLDAFSVYDKCVPVLHTMTIVTLQLIGVRSFISGGGGG